MSILEIPISVGNDGLPLPAFDTIIPLEGVNYTLTFRWSARPSAWIFSVATQDGTPVAQGLGLRVGVLFQVPNALSNAPPGAFYVNDISESGFDPGRFDLGQRVLLIYFTSDELAGILP